MTPSTPRAPCDTECYPNYWLFGIQLGPTVWQAEAAGPGARLSQSDRDRIVWLLDNVPIWTFNGLGYDQWLIGAAAVSGMSVEQLKTINDKIIVDRVKPWQLGLPRWAPRDHIDIMEVIPGAGGQKYKAGIIHYKTMQDLPYSPDTLLGPRQMAEVKQYNANDLGQLAALAEAVKPQIQLREKLTERYGIDLRSKSDAQVAEAVLKHRCEQALGRRIAKTEPDWNIRFNYNPPAFLHFESDRLREIIAIAKGAEFRLSASGAVCLPDGLEGLRVGFGTSVYRLGIGGLHSSEECAAHVADDEYVLLDVDVASYYPSLMLEAGAWPDALGPQFLREFAALKESRLADKVREGELKAAGDTSSAEYEAAHAGNNGGKIMINGTFGKTGSVWSPLFAPKMMIQTTLTGQLALLMLAERMELAGIAVVSANTDGLVLKPRRVMLDTARAIVKQWESDTGLEMEEAGYKAIYARDVNNYLAVKSNGGVKRKGQYAPTDLIMKKAPSCEICADACAAYVGDGVPVEVTVLSCTDIRKFVAIKNVAGGAAKMRGDGPRSSTKVADMLPRLLAHGWTKRGARWERGDEEPILAAEAYAQTFEPQVREEIGKVIRYYYSCAAPGPIVYASGKKAGDLVSDTWGAEPCMVLPESLPSDIDYAWYIERAYTMLRECGAIK